MLDNKNILVTQINLVAHPSYLGKRPENVRIEDVFILDIKKKTKIKLLDWIKGFQKDPKVITQLKSRDEKNAINHYEYTIPCNPNIGFGVGENGWFIRLEKVILFADSLSIGDTFNIGPDTKLILN